MSNSEQNAEIILNRNLGGFSFSDEFHDFLITRISDLRLSDFEDVTEEDIELDFEDHDEIEVRTAPSLIRLMREFGIEKSQGPHSRLRIFKIDKFLVPFIRIRSYDGCETLEFLFEEFWIKTCTECVSNDDIVSCLHLFFADKRKALLNIDAPPPNL